MKILGLVKGGMILLSKHKSGLLAATAIGGAVGTTIATVKATVKAVEKIDDIQAKRAIANEDGTENAEPQRLTKLEILDATWKYYIPVAIGLVTTTVCIVCAHRIDAKRIATATSALLLSEKMNKELENKTAKELGKDKLKEIKAKIFDENPDLKKREISRTMPVPTSPHPVFHDEKCWFKEEITGQVFCSSRNEVERAINNATKEALGGSGIVSLNMFLDFLGREGCVMGDMLGWRLDHQDFDVGSYEPDIMENGVPGLIIRYMGRPSLI